MIDAKPQNSWRFSGFASFPNSVKQTLCQRLLPGLISGERIDNQHLSVPLMRSIVT